MRLEIIGVLTEMHRERLAIVHVASKYVYIVW